MDCKITTSVVTHVYCSLAGYAGALGFSVNKGAPHSSGATGSVTGSAPDDKRHNSAIPKAAVRGRACSRQAARAAGLAADNKSRKGKPNKAPPGTHHITTVKTTADTSPALSAGAHQAGASMDVSSAVSTQRCHAHRVVAPPASGAKLCTTPCHTIVCGASSRFQQERSGNTQG